MKWIVDRIENDIAVCEIDDERLEVSTRFLPEGVSEGDIITLAIDKTQTEERKENIEKLMNNLFKD